MEDNKDLKNEAQDLDQFESDFTWSDVETVDDTEALFFGGMYAKM